MNESICWVNNLKLIGMLTVVLGHISSPFSSFIYSFHMPFFFMLSGFFIRFDLSFKDSIKKDFKRLMIPYFIFAFMGIIVEAIKRVVLQRPSLEIAHELSGILWGMNYQALQNHYGFVLWFLPTLFFAKQLIRSGVLVFVLFILSFYLKLPFGLDVAMNAVLWVWLGSALYPHYQKRINLRLLLVLWFLFLLLLFLNQIPRLDIASKTYEFIPLNLFWPLLVVSLLAWSLNRVNHVIGSTWLNESMLIFIFHPYTNNIAHYWLNSLGCDVWQLKFIISLGLLTLMIKFKHRFRDWRIFQYV